MSQITHGRTLNSWICMYQYFSYSCSEPFKAQAGRAQSVRIPVCLRHCCKYRLKRLRQNANVEPERDNGAWSTADSNAAFAEMRHDHTAKTAVTGQESWRNIPPPAWRLQAGRYSEWRSWPSFDRTEHELSSGEAFSPLPAPITHATSRSAAAEKPRDDPCSLDICSVAQRRHKSIKFTKHSCSVRSK